MDNNLINKPKAGFLIRLVAVWSDSLILALLPLLYLYFSNLGTLNIKNLIIVLGWYLILFGFFGNILAMLYTSLLTSYSGGTLGKLIAGLRVINDKGENLSVPLSLFRSIIGYAVSGLLFGLGFFWIIKDPNKQGWHDHLTGSYVVKKQNGVFRAILFLILILIIDLFLFISNISKIVGNTNLKEEIQTVQSLIKEDNVSGEDGPDQNYYFNKQDEFSLPEGYQSPDYSEL